jgi:hypothetical protein
MWEHHKIILLQSKENKGYAVNGAVGKFLSMIFNK